MRGTHCAKHAGLVCWVSFGNGNQIRIIFVNRLVVGKIILFVLCLFFQSFVYSISAADASLSHTKKTPDLYKSSKCATLIGSWDNERGRRTDKSCRRARSSSHYKYGLREHFSARRRPFFANSCWWKISTMDGTADCGFFLSFWIGTLSSARTNEREMDKTVSDVGSRLSGILCMCVLLLGRKQGCIEIFSPILKKKTRPSCLRHPEQPWQWRSDRRGKRGPFCRKIRNIKNY